MHDLDLHYTFELDHILMMLTTRVGHNFGENFAKKVSSQE